MTKAVILGAGAYGEVYLYYLRESGVEVVGFLDDNRSKHNLLIDGAPVLGPIDALGKISLEGISVIYAPIGDNETRRRILQKARKMGLETPNYVHPDAVVSSDIGIGKAIYILPGTVIMPKVSLGDAVMVSMGVRVAHHSILGAGVFLSTGVSIGANVNIGENAYFGMNATAVTGKCKSVGPSAVIGACSNLLSDIPARTTAVGNPARLLKKD